MPLLHVDTEFHFSRRWSLVADLDAAWAPQGRAIDFALKARHAGDYGSIQVSQIDATW